ASLFKGHIKSCSFCSMSSTIRLVNQPNRVFRNNFFESSLVFKILTGNPECWLTSLIVEDMEQNEHDLICPLNNEAESKDSFLGKIKIGDEDKGNAEKLRHILWNYRDVFSGNKRDLGCAGIKHKIVTVNHSPIALKPRRIPQALESQVDKQVKQMLDNSIIRESTSPWSFPLVVVRKPNGDLRLCVDYRKLNEITRRPIYPIPESRTIFDTLEGNQNFTSLDLSSGYHQVPMEEEDKAKTAFSTRRGQFEFNRMPFGLCGAPATFQRIMNVILKDQVWQKCVIYLDDVLIFGRTVEEHNERLIEVLEQFRKAGMKLSPSKCVFSKTQIKYLGHIISEKGIATDPDKIKSIVKWSTPQCVDEVHSFVGLCNYYRAFIPNFSSIIEPLQRIITSKKLKETEKRRVICAVKERVSECSNIDITQ
ncbi:MAG: reverse transcriptase family protein, partial [Pseudomonadota bacterium]